MIYISCAYKDHPLVKPLVEKLRAMGFWVFFDEGVECGSQWPEYLTQGLKNSDHVLVFLSSKALNSPNCRRELSFAMELGKSVIPVYLEELELTPGMKLQMSAMSSLRYRGDEDAFLRSLCAELGQGGDLPAFSRGGEEAVQYSRVTGEEMERRIEALSRRMQEDEQAKAEAERAMRCAELRMQETDRQEARRRAYAEQQRLQRNRPTPPQPPVYQVPVPGLHVEAPRGYMPEDASREIDLPMPAPMAAPPMSAPMAAPQPQQAPPMSAPMAAPKPNDTEFVPPATGKKLGLGERVKRLFQKTDTVGFSALAPAEFMRGEYAMVDVYAYEEQFRQVVDKAIAEKGMKETDGGRLQIKKGTRITVFLSSPDVEITDNEESQVWAGQYAKFDFPVFVPGDFAKHQILFRAVVYFDDIIATRIRFLADVRAKQIQQVPVERRDVHSAFISYASADRDRVVLILQGMRRSRPDLNIFFDVETLRSGEDWRSVLEREIESRDVLFLCWSQAAKASEWVDFEWRYAYERKGEEGIEPIPLERPEKCPPPAELKNKHFGARELYYIQE